jgi:putative transposase
MNSHEHALFSLDTLTNGPFLYESLHYPELTEWCKAEGEWDLEVVERTPDIRGFSVQPRRWVVERTFGWLSCKRRLSKDYERKVQTSETFIQVAMIRLLLARLGRIA